MKEAQASFQKASEEWARDQADISERVRQAKRVRDQEIADADDTKASEVESANEDFKAKTAEAHLAHEQMKGACASNFAQTSAILDQDEATIKQVEGLVSQLHMCEDAATKAQDTPPAATTSFLESRALRGTFDDQSDDQAFLETGTAAGCQAVRSKLARVRGNGNSGVATGTVEDMKKSLQLARHKAAEDKAKCDDRAQAMFTDSSQKAQTHHSAGLEAADEKHTSATATANTKYLEATRMLDRLLQEAKAKYERAQEYLQSRTADRDAASAEAKAKGELITSPDGPVMTAEARAASEAAEAHKRHDEKVQAAAATKADSVANAESAHAQSIRDINAQCEEEIQQLEAEKRTVETVQDSLKAIKLVNHDSTTTTAAAATTAAPEAGSTNFVYIKPGESCVAKGFAELTSAQCEARGNEEDSKSLNGEVSGFMGETDSQATPPEAACVQWSEDYAGSRPRQARKIVEYHVSNAPASSRRCPEGSHKCVCMESRVAPVTTRPPVIMDGVKPPSTTAPVTRPPIIMDGVKPPVFTTPPIIMDGVKPPSTTAPVTKVPVITPKPIIMDGSRTLPPRACPSATDICAGKATCAAGCPCPRCLAPATKVPLTTRPPIIADGVRPPVATTPPISIDQCLDTNYAVENYSICCANGGYKKEGHGPICGKVAPCVKGGFNHPDCTLSVLATTTSPRVCCMAMTATCLSCAAGVTKEEYCASNPKVAGCPKKPAPYDPCANKREGEACSLCAPGDKNCMETKVLKTCDGAGKCRPGMPFTSGCASAADICAGRAKCLAGCPCPKCLPPVTTDHPKTASPTTPEQ